jgi:uncharacterized protein YceK
MKFRVLALTAIIAMMLSGCNSIEKTDTASTEQISGVSGSSVAGQQTETGVKFEPIPDGVYITDKLLYTSPYKDSFFGDDNGMKYEINGNLLTMSGTLILDGQSEYTISEPMEIPFTNEEWDETFDIVDGIGWIDGEINLNDYSDKYCVQLTYCNPEKDTLSPSDSESKEYIFFMDGEIWYVQNRIEIYRLKLADASSFSEKQSVETSAIEPRIEVTRTDN